MVGLPFSARPVASLLRAMQHGVLDGESDLQQRLKRHFNPPETSTLLEDPVKTARMQQVSLPLSKPSSLRLALHDRRPRHRFPGETC